MVQESGVLRFCAEHSHVFAIFQLCVRRVRHPHFHVNASAKSRTARSTALAPSVAVVINTLLPPPPSFPRLTDRVLVFLWRFSLYVLFLSFDKPK